MGPAAGARVHQLCELRTADRRGVLLSPGGEAHHWVGVDTFPVGLECPLTSGIERSFRFHVAEAGTRVYLLRRFPGLSVTGRVS